MSSSRFTHCHWILPYCSFRDSFLPPLLWCLIYSGTVTHASPFSHIIPADGSITQDAELAPLALRESFCLIKSSQYKAAVQSFILLLCAPVIHGCSCDGFSRPNPGIRWCERADCCFVFCLGFSCCVCTVPFVSLTFCALYKLRMSHRGKDPRESFQ